MSLLTNNLPYYVRASLYSRLAFWASFDTGLAARGTPSLSAGSAYSALTARIQYLTNNYGKPPFPEGSYETPMEFLSRVVEDRDLAVLKKDPIYRRCAINFSKHLKTINCHNCARRFNSSCWIRHPDFIELSDAYQTIHGPCAKWLFALITYVNRCVAEYYNDILTACKITPKPIHYIARFLGDPPNVLDKSVYIDADTSPPRHDPEKIVVTLRICPNFDRRSYLTLPYILFHEAFCHAYEMIGLDTKQDASPMSSCSFGEGWMDLIALRCLEAELGYSQILPGLIRRQFLEIQSHAHEFLQKRYALHAPGDPKLRREGRRLCRKLEEVIQKFENIFEPSEPPPFRGLPHSRCYLMKISFLVNVTADSRQRALFVRYVEKFTMHSLTNPTGKQDGQILVRALKDFLGHRNISMLLSVLESHTRRYQSLNIAS